MSSIADIISRGSKDARDIMLQGTETVANLDELRDRPYRRAQERLATNVDIATKKAESDSTIATEAQQRDESKARIATSAFEQARLDREMKENKDRADKELLLRATKQKQEMEQDNILFPYVEKMAEENLENAKLVRQQQTLELVPKAEALVDQFVALFLQGTKGDKYAATQANGLISKITEDESVRTVLGLSPAYFNFSDIKYADWAKLSPEYQAIFVSGLQTFKATADAKAQEIADRQAAMLLTANQAAAKGTALGTGEANLEIMQMARDAGISLETPKARTEGEMTNERQREGSLWYTTAKNIIKETDLKDSGFSVDDFANMDHNTFEAERDAMYKLLTAVTTQGTFTFGGKTFTFDKKNIEENIDGILELAQASESGMFMGTSPYYTMLNYLKGENLKGWEKVAETTGVKQNVGAAAAKLTRSAAESQ